MNTTQNGKKTSNMLKNGGWTFQGSREDIIIDETDSAGRRYQITRCSDQTGPHSGGEQFRQQFTHHLLRCDLGVKRLDTRSRASRKDLREAASVGREALEANVPIVIIRRRRAGFSDDGARA